MIARKIKTVFLSPLKLYSQMKSKQFRKKHATSLCESRKIVLNFRTEFEVQECQNLNFEDRII